MNRVKTVVGRLLYILLEGFSFTKVQYRWRICTGSGIDARLCVDNLTETTSWCSCTALCESRAEHETTSIVFMTKQFLCKPVVFGLQFHSLLVLEQCSCENVWIELICLQLTWLTVCFVSPTYPSLSIIDQFYDDWRMLWVKWAKCSSIVSQMLKCGIFAFHEHTNSFQAIHMFGMMFTCITI